MAGIEKAFCVNCHLSTRIDQKMCQHGNHEWAKKVNQVEATVQGEGLNCRVRRVPRFEEETAERRVSVHDAGSLIN